MEYFSKKIENLQGKLRFEAPQTLVIDGKEVARVYDATIEHAGGITKYELKNWVGWYPSSIKNQFIKDIQNIEKLDELKWVFNTTSGVNKSNLKEKIISTLKKADGTPIEEIITNNTIKKTIKPQTIIIFYRNKRFLAVKKHHQPALPKKPLPKQP